MTHADRFWSKVDASGVCWEWSASSFPTGYGAFHLDGQMAYAHRVAWELLVGDIPSGLQLDHLCRNKRCVNPDHLEPVTQAENMRRARLAHIGGVAYGAKVEKVKTQCPQGHPYSGDNVRVRKNGHRVCVTCKRDRDNERYRARRSAA